MPNVYDGNTFKETYRDDYAESDGYHRILFNSGRALQARELTQSQTILQNQITTFGENIFLDGASANPKSAGIIGTAVSYIKITTPSGIDINSMVGAYFRRTANSSGTPTTPLEFQISHIVLDPSDVNDSNYIVIYGRYIGGNGDDLTASITDSALNAPTFDAGDVITDTLELAGNPSRFPPLTVHPSAVFGPDGVTTEGASNVGLGFIVSTQSTKFFTQGHFVIAPSQSIVGSLFNPTPDLDLGFEVIQDIITVDDTDALYDNQGVLPNLSSPGADRYRIRLILTTKASIPVDSDGSMTADYVSFATIRDGIIVQLKEGTEGYNQVERRMALRHHDTHGSFIVNPFDIRYEEGRNVIDSAAPLIDRVSEDYMFANLPTPLNSINPLAFVDGYRLEHEVPIKVEINKPLSTTLGDEVDIRTDYNNYVTVTDSIDSAFSSAVFQTETDFDNQKRLGLLDSASGDIIGYTRVKTVKRSSTGDDAYRVHLFDIQMNEGMNFRDVERISMLTDSVTASPDYWFDPVREDGQLYLNDPLTNDNLFPIPGGRVKTLDNVSFTVEKFFIGTIASGNSFTLSTARSDDKFDEVASWIIVDTTTDTVLNPFLDFTVAGEGTNNATVTILSPTIGDYSVYAQVEKTVPRVTTKNYQEKWMDAERGDSDENYRVYMSGDLMYDGVRLIEAYENDSAAQGPSVRDFTSMDGGQRDNYYGPITLDKGRTNATTRKLRVRMGYFEWSQGDYISVNSYTAHLRTEAADSDNPIFLYSDIPSYTTKIDGKKIPLEDYLDFRSKLDPSAMEMTIPRHDLPLDDGFVSADVTYYNNRVDIISLGYNTSNLTPEFRLNRGPEALEPKAPQQKKNELPLFSVTMNGNTKSPDDLFIERYEHKGFKMKDIANLEGRVAELEETVSLSFLENNAANLVELDSDGGVRSKTGFFVDDFTRGMLYTSSILGPDYMDDANLATQTLHLNNATVYPKSNYETATMIWDEDNSLQANGIFPNGNHDVIRKGDNIYLDYREVLDPSMKQEMISWYSDGRSSEEQGYYNVNPYNVFAGEGRATLSPGSDYSQETRRIPQRILDGGTIERLLNATLVPRIVTSTRTSSSTSVGPWTGQPIARTTTTTSTTTTRWQNVATRVIGAETLIQDLGDRIVATHSLPWMRQRRIFGKAEGLRPNTRYWPFFDGVDVTQWVVRITGPQHDAALNDRKHLMIEDPEVSVGILEHPDAASASSQTLITDGIGEVYFEFFLPNTAPLPNANSLAFNSEEEWANWVNMQRQETKRFGGPKDPNVFNETGWKFKSGTLPFKLLDISEDNEDNALSKARTTFTSSKDLNIVSQHLLSTRVIVKENYYVNGEILSQSSSSNTSVTWFDPLAQTFLIDPQIGMPGAYVTKIDVFLRSAPLVTDPQIPIQLQVRAVENGYPTSGAISDQHRVYVPASEARANVEAMEAAGGNTNLGAVLGHPTTFEFKEPIYVQAGTEYAICLLSECDGYQAYVATTYGLILGKTNTRVSKQPALGSLFLSQNGSTWTAKQNQDLAYRIYTAKFKQEGEAIFQNQPYQRYTHNNTDAIQVVAGENKFRVVHLGHGLGVGDKPQLTGLDSAQTYFGVMGTEMMDNTAVIDSADISSYTVSTTTPFTTSGSFGTLEMQSNRCFYINEIRPNYNNVLVPQTNINIEGSFISGVNYSDISETDTNDPRFDILNTPLAMANIEEQYMKNVKMLAAPYMEEEVYGTETSSIQMKLKLISDQESRFGGEDAIAVAASGYVSDVSPIVDTQRTSIDLTSFLIDNQAREDEDISDLMNVPVFYEPETHPVLGSSPSKHITRPITLESPANSIRVFLEMYKPAASSFDVYYRTSNDPDADMYALNWNYVAPENSPPNSTFALNDGSMEYKEWTYLMGGKTGTLPDFVTFQLKIVFRSTNSSEIPVMKSLRAIAVV